MNPFLVRNALILLALSALSVGLISLRGRLFHRRVGPMLWNLLLAWTPMVLVTALDAIVIDTPDLVDDRVAVVAFVAVLALFALFLPNASYLITELGHVHERGRKIPTWFDVISILSLAMCGVLLCCVSLAYAQLILDRSVVGATWSWVFVVSSVLLANVGVYVGRELRFNSWDAILHPRRLLTRVGRYLVAERRYREVAAYALSFSAVLICVYLVVALPLLS